MKRRIGALAVALALLLGVAAQAAGYQIDPANEMNFGMLLVELMHAYENPRAEDAEAVKSTVAAIAGASASDGEVARAIAEHWSRVYVNADGSYRLYLYGGGERAAALEETDMRDSAAHAFVVLGFELKDGRMTDELVGRCRAAAAAARLPINIGGALKKPINDRIRATCILMGSGRFFVTRRCKETADALKSALWDGKKLTEDVRLDDGTTNIDSLDAMEYALERYIPELIEKWNFQS